jgi:hypothetical protein
MTDSHDTLDRYLDDLANGDVATTGQLDPGLVETIRRLAAIGRSSTPRPDFVDQLEERLMGAGSEAATAPSPPIRMRRVTMARVVPISSARSATGARRWLPILVSAALILLLLGLAWRALGPGRPDRNPRLGVPAIHAPASPSPEASPTTTLFTITLPAGVVPHTTERITGISHDKYLAGSTSVWRPYCCDGPVVQYQLTGAIQVTGTAELQIVRADGTVDHIPANTEATVNTGDTLVTLNQTEITTVNNGTIDAEILNWALLDSPGDSFGGRGGQDGLVGMTHAGASDFLGNLVDLPGAVTVTLQRLELEPEQAVYPPEGGVQMALTLDTYTEWIITAGDGSYIKADNTNGTPTTTVYVVTLLPADSSGPPGASTPGS